VYKRQLLYKDFAFNRSLAMYGYNIPANMMRDAYTKYCSNSPALYFSSIIDLPIITIDAGIKIINKYLIVISTSSQ